MSTIETAADFLFEVRYFLLNSDTVSVDDDLTTDDVIDSFNCKGLRAGKVVLWADDEDDDGVKSYITWSIAIYDDEGWTIAGINGGHNAEQLWDGVATTEDDVKAIALKLAEAIRIASED